MNSNEQIDSIAAETAQAMERLIKDKSPERIIQGKPPLSEATRAKPSLNDTTAKKPNPGGSRR